MGNLEENLGNRMYGIMDQENFLTRKRLIPHMTLQLLKLKNIKNKIETEKENYDIKLRRDFHECTRECRRLVDEYEMYLSSEIIYLKSDYSITKKEIEEAYFNRYNGGEELIVGLCAHASYLGQNLNLSKKSIRTGRLKQSELKRIK